ncbi:MAG: DUF4019 domain-containing protein [Nibricoccus sp.]
MKTFVALALVCSGLWWAGCTSLNQSIANQNAIISQIHEHFNTGNFDAIWLSAHPRFQAETEKTKFSEYLQTVKEKLGKAVSTANSQRRFSTANQKTLVFLVQQTAFEKDRATETITVEMEGDQPILVAYNIQSKLLDAQ